MKKSSLIFLPVLLSLMLQAQFASAQTNDPKWIGGRKHASDYSFTGESILFRQVSGMASKSPVLVSGS